MRNFIIAACIAAAVLMGCKHASAADESCWPTRDEVEAGLKSEGAPDMEVVFEAPTSDGETSIVIYQSKHLGRWIMFVSDGRCMQPVDSGLLQNLSGDAQ